MCVPSGISEFCFSSNLNVLLDFASGNIESLGKTKLFPSRADIRCIMYFRVLYNISALANDIS